MKYIGFVLKEIFLSCLVCNK